MKLCYFGAVALLLQQLATGVVALNGLCDDDSYSSSSTNNAAKVEMSMHASVDTDAELTALNPVDIDVVIYESDLAWKYDNGVSSGDRVHYATCFFLNSTAYQEDGLRQEAGCSLQRLDTSTPYGTNPNRTTFSYTQTGVDASADANDLGCGIRVKTNLIIAVVACHRQVGFDQPCDVIVELSVPTANVVVNTLHDDITVGPIAKIDVESLYEVTMKMYTAATPSLPTAVPTDTGDANYADVADGVSIGDLIYIEMVLDSRSGLIYWIDLGSSPVAVYPHTCVLSYSYTPDLAALNSPITFIGADGCAENVQVFGMEWGGNRYMVSFADGNTDELKQRVPSTIRTELMETILVANLKSRGPYEVTVTCQTGYCFNFTDPRCFSTPTCARRKRSVEEPDERNIPEGLPSELSVSFTITMPEAELDTGDSVVSPCPEKKTFYVLTAVFALLLLVVIAIAGGMIVKMNSFSLDEGSSVSSVKKGVNNAGYH